MNDLSGELEVWQSNRLVEAAQTLTLNEKRLVIAAAALHDPRKPLPSKGTVTLHADDFADVFGIQSRGHVYEALADAAKRLGNRWIRTIYTRAGKPAERNVRWVWMVDYRQGEGTVTLGFSPGLGPYLTMLHTEFTRYKLKQIGNIGSFYGLRLYELCAQFRKGGQRTIPLARLREMLDLGDKYGSIKDLRVRVLDPALKEINKHTDLRVLMTPERKGRKVVGFHFDITQDDQIPLDLPLPEDSAPALSPVAATAEPAITVDESIADSEQRYYGIQEQWRCDDALIEARIAELEAQREALRNQRKGTGV